MRVPFKRRPGARWTLACGVAAVAICAQSAFAQCEGGGGAAAAAGGGVAAFAGGPVAFGGPQAFTAQLQAQAMQQQMFRQQMMMQMAAQQQQQRMAAFQQMRSGCSQADALRTRRTRSQPDARDRTNGPRAASDDKFAHIREFEEQRRAELAERIAERDAQLQARREAADARQVQRILAANSIR